MMSAVKACTTTCCRIVSDLLNRRIAEESEGAIVVYLDEFKIKEGEPMGLLSAKRWRISHTTTR